MYVDDHVRALLHVAFNGKIDETYNIGGHNEIQNIEVVRTICRILDELLPSKNNISKYEDLISFVDDRPGHDARYAIDASKISKDLGWTPDESFSSGVRKTVQWYLENTNWCNKVSKKTNSYEKGEVKS